ncbi:MAG: hypothetical protein NZ529_05165 [Cytophagaceae bacterium]|nr:hypothetical protein [Cytophagaceae bacterium]MDW8456166.1 hypothetical protein [Cytophagaceae bacterium]
MKIRLCLSLWMFCSSFVVFSQYKFSSDPATFPQDVNAMFVNTKQPSAMQTGTAFLSAFPTFSNDHQKKIIETSQKLAKSKKMRATPHFADFFSSLVAAKNKGLSNANIDTLLIIVNTLVDKMDANQFGTVLQTLNHILEYSMLYKSSYNRLRFSGGSFSFRYIQSAQNNVDFSDDATQDTTSNQQNYFSDWDTQEINDTGFGTLEDQKNKKVDLLDVGYNYPTQPQREGAIVEFTNVDLSFATASDSAVLRNTNGYLLLSKGNIFVGKGGTMDWSSAGLAPGEIVCTMREFNFPVKNTRFVSEGALLSYKSKVDSLIEGIFEYKEVKVKSKADAQHPRFKSFKSNIDVKGLDANITYKGGFSLAGRKIFSSSVDEGFATIIIKQDGKPKIKAESNRFELGDSVISSNFAYLTLYIEEDSIYHPGTVFQYNKQTSTMRVLKKEGFGYAPFIDTYHKLEIICDEVIWDLNKKEIEFNIINAKSHIPATFESEDFFNLDKFYKLRGLYRFHPLQVIVAHADKIRFDEFYASDVARNIGADPTTFKGAMVMLMKLGYIDFNVKTGLIRLRPKARHYVISSRNKKDYDNITFISLNPAGYNASLNVETHEILVRGVDRIYISDSLKVNFTPDNKQISIEKNRNFKFDGQINTENFQFVGKKFEFVYDSFLVHMPEIDQIRLAVTTKSKNKKNTKDTSDVHSKSRILGNELRYSSGTLYINRPDNKSARKKLAQYPIFDANTGASVYFNKKNINGGAYDTTVQFVIPPFRLDSLSSDDPHTIGFDGTFKSGGIFPDFKEKLVVMPDFSLGFSHKVPKDGYQLYKGSGKFYNTITLTNKGIRGDGYIKYISTTLWSKDFVFFQDSVLTEGSKAETKPGPHPDAQAEVTFPKMETNEYRLKWLPKSDSMLISSIKKPLKLYDSTAFLYGTSIITRGGMRGKGIVHTRGSETESFNYHFEQKKYAARNAKFKIESDDPDKPALQGTDVKLKFDLENNIAYFSPEVEGAASISFPYVQYKSSLQDGVWHLQNKTVTMSMPEGGDISKSYFYSTRKDQDSLVYNATKGVYDIEKQILNISGVPYINVADAAIYPDSGKVIVEQNAVMRTLKKAKIEIDTVKRYHYLYNGTIDIESRLKFSGVATYRYVNLGDDTLAIRFQDFRLEPGRKKKEGMHTVATGLVKEDDSLFVGPKIIYKGKVTLYAESPYLIFDGFIKLDLKGALSYSEWIKYNNDGETKEVRVDLKNAVSDNGVPLSTGIHIDRKTNQIYTSFISKKNSQTDPDIFLADKSFRYDLDSNHFLVGNMDKFDQKVFQGNNLRYDDSKSIIKYSGKFTLLEPNDNIKAVSAGDGYANLNEGDYSLSPLIAFDIKLDKKITSAMSKKLKEAAEYATDSTEEFLTPEKQFEQEQELYRKLGPIIGDAGIENYKTKKSMGPVSLLSLSKELGKTITFKNVNLKWSKIYKSFYSVGKIEVAGMQKTDINKAIDGYLEIRKSNKGDVVNIYLQPTASTWFFISYSENRLSMISSDDATNKAILAKSKGEMPDRSKFYFVAAEPVEKQRFLVEFRNHYLGQTEEETPVEDIPIETETDPQQPKAKPAENTDIDINEPEIGEEKPKPAPAPDTTAKKKKKKEPNYDQYTLPDQNNDASTEEEKEKKEKPTLEDQKQKQLDQQKVKDLFR